MPKETLRALIQKVSTGTTLSGEEIRTALEIMTDGHATHAQMGAFLMALRVRGETVEELAGAARMMRSRMHRVAAPAGAVDIVGTGGDSHGTYNVSTCASLVAAGACLTIAKHGNRSVSSISGASDVLGALGVKLDVPPAVVSRAIQEAGVGFMFAPAHHSAMKFVGPTRVELGTRTIFNLLGPVSNPAGVKRLLIGVFARQWVEPIANTMRRLGAERVWVVHGSDGLDEITTTGPTYAAEAMGGLVRTFMITPEDIGVRRAAPEALKGAGAEANAAAIRAVLAGEPGPFRDIVLINAGAALVVAGKADDLKEGATLAARAIDTGAAAAALEALKRISHE